jgi:hypothetical protein
VRSALSGQRAKGEGFSGGAKRHGGRQQKTFPADAWEGFKLKFYVSAAGVSGNPDACRLQLDPIFS